MTQQVATEMNGIRIDGGTQPRARLDEAIVEEYATAIMDGAVFPPVVVFNDGKDCWLADGFHRFHAHRKAGMREIGADVRVGTRRDAVLYSFGANNDHGLRRSNEDKRGAVRAMLADSEWAAWSDRDIAKQCKVSHPFVAKMRPVTGNVSSENVETRTYTNKHGTESEMKTGQISDANKLRANAAPAIAPPETPKSEPVGDSATDPLDEANDRAHDLAVELEAYMIASGDDGEGAKEIMRLNGLIETLKKNRDEWQNKCAELMKQVKSEQAKVKRLEAKLKTVSADGNF